VCHGQDITRSGHTGSHRGVMDRVVGLVARRWRMF
jgi:hypothetical protein